MRYPTILSLIVVLPLCALAQTGGTPTEAQRIEAEMKKLQEEPGVKEVFDLSKKITELRGKSNQQENELYQQMDKLEQSDAYKQYAEKYNALAAKLEAVSEADRNKLKEAARQLYQSRHEELQKLATRDLPGARALGLDVLSYPRVDGSTSTQPLAAILAARVLGVTYEWAYPEPSGWLYQRAPAIPERFTFAAAALDYSRADLDLNIAASRTYATGKGARDERIAAMINAVFAKNSNTHDAYVHLIEGSCDVNFTARPPSPDETKLAKEKNAEIELIPIATDALVFIVNNDNPVKSLTTDQLKSIYQLNTTGWKALGGNEGAIRPVLREANSGSRELFDALFFPTPTDENYRRATGSLYVGSMGGPYNVITTDKMGIGYSVYYYEHFMALSPYTRTLAVNGIEPNAETLASGKYPFAAPVYVAVRKSDAADSPGRKLAGYLASAEGQAIVRESGYVPVKR